MQFRKPYYYSEFKCIADKCPATCCDGWAVVVDEDSIKKYKNLPSEDRDYVMSHIDEEEGTFVQCDGRCSFLNDNGLCDLCSRYGEEMFSRTCRRYPRHFEEYGNLHEAALSMSCPVAAKMIVTNPKKDYYLVANNKKNSPNRDEVDRVLLAGLLMTRDYIFEIMNDRSYPLSTRMRRVLHYTDKIQKLIYNYERLGNKVKRSCTVTEFLLKLDMITSRERLSAAANYSEGDLNYIHPDSQFAMNCCTDTVLLLENINDAWPVMIYGLKEKLYENMSSEEYLSKRAAFDLYMKDQMYEYEHIFNYFIYTYYLGGVYDYNILSMVKLAILSVAIIRDLGMLNWISNDGILSEEEQLRICYLYSRQIEHSDENISSLEGLLIAHPNFDKKNIISII